MVQGILSWQFTLLLAMDMPLQLQEQEGKVVEGVSLRWGGTGASQTLPSGEMALSFVIYPDLFSA